MADDFIQIQPDSTGKKVDSASLTVGTNTVERQRIIIGDNSTAGNYLAVDSNGAIAITASGNVNNGLLPGKAMLVAGQGSNGLTPIAVDNLGKLYVVQPAGTTFTHIWQDGPKFTYGSGVLAFAPAATPTDVFEFWGSLTGMTVRILRITVQALATTAGTMDMQIIKRTAANTGGTVTQINTQGIVEYDSTTGTPTVTLNKVTANRAALGSGAPLWAGKLGFPVAASANIPQYVFDFGTRPGAQALVLRGGTQGVVINLAGGTVPSGGTIAVSVEWTEE